MLSFCVTREYEFIRRGRSTIGHKCPGQDVWDRTQSPGQDVPSQTSESGATDPCPDSSIWDGTSCLRRPDQDVLARTFMSYCTSAPSLSSILLCTLFPYYYLNALGFCTAGPKDFLYTTAIPNGYSADFIIWFLIYSQLSNDPCFPSWLIKSLHKTPIESTNPDFPTLLKAFPGCKNHSIWVQMSF